MVKPRASQKPSARRWIHGKSRLTSPLAHPSRASAPAAFPCDRCGKVNFWCPVVICPFVVGKHPIILKGFYTTFLRCLSLAENRHYCVATMIGGSLMIESAVLSASLEGRFSFGPSGTLKHRLRAFLRTQHLSWVPKHEEELPRCTGVGYQKEGFGRRKWCSCLKESDTSGTSQSLARPGEPLERGVGRGEVLGSPCRKFTFLWVDRICQV